MTKREKMYQQIQQHGENLNKIFDTGLEPVKLCKKLHSLEMKAHKLSTDYCNGENGVTSENWDEKCAPILQAVEKVLNCTEMAWDTRENPIFVNGDARGYALKINDSYTRMLRDAGKNLYSDWGGYGILCPEFTGA